MQVAALAQGFFISLGLILAIGAQNAFVLRQGLRGEHVALVCFTCAFSDALLITTGVSGFGVILSTAPWIDPVFRTAGITFLVVYGLRSWYSAWRGIDQGLVASDTTADSWRIALATCLAFTWLNPHVYLDTVILLGSVSSGFEGRRIAFTIGAICGSFAFFFALGFGARLLRPIFAKAAAWRILDVAIGFMMIAIAVGLARSA
ncbi:MAG: LysE/ArgO family amino acid transporter [Granulosicoccus sp.]